MKNNFKKYFFSALTIVSASVLLTACDKNNDDMDDNNQYTISGTASGAQETPAVTTSAAGTLSGTYNANTNTLNYVINWTGLSGNATVAHFHGPADVGIAADPLIPVTISTNGATGSASGSVVIVDSVETALLNGKIYYNVHTAAHPTGEIRGQVSTTAN